MQLPLPAAHAALPAPSPSCSTTPTPAPSPTHPPYTCVGCVPPPLPADEVAIPPAYQRQNPVGGTLAWQLFPPIPTPGTTPPGIVLVHGSGWNAGNSHDIEGVAIDLRQAGYCVVSINYELAPCGLIPAQPCHANDGTTDGWWVNREVQDVEAFVTAFRDSGLVKPDKIGIVGGSAGATLAILIALDTTSTNGAWPYWSASVRLACVVLLSAVYDFADRTPPEGETVMAPTSIRKIENFTQTGSATLQKQLSPVYKVKTPTAQEPFVPAYMISSQYDPVVPYHNLVDMLCALQSKSVPASSYQTLYLPGSDLHSFGYWGSCDNPLATGPSCTLVKTDVIAYLDAHLK